MKIYTNELNALCGGNEGIDAAEVFIRLPDGQVFQIIEGEDGLDVNDSFPGLCPECQSHPIWQCDFPGCTDFVCEVCEAEITEEEFRAIWEASVQ